jgi:hypothetical protein
MLLPSGSLTPCLSRLHPRRTDLILIPLRRSHLQSPHHFRQHPRWRLLACPLVCHPLHLHVELASQEQESPTMGKVVTTLQASDAETTVKAIKAAEGHST